MSLPKVPVGYDACSILPAVEHRSNASAPWVTITDSGNLFYTSTLADAVDTLKHLGYRAVKQSGAGALYKASASAKLREIFSRVNGASMSIKPVTAMSDSKEEKFDYEEWKKSNVAPRKPANHKDAQDLYDAQKRVNEKRETSAPEEIKDYEAWQQAVKDAYPDVANKLKFKGRIENGKDTVSAEVPGEDRSYGVWDSDKDVGHVLTSSTVTAGILEDLSTAKLDFDSAKTFLEKYKDILEQPYPNKHTFKILKGSGLQIGRVATALKKACSPEVTIRTNSGTLSIDWNYQHPMQGEVMFDYPIPADKLTECVTKAIATSKGTGGGKGWYVKENGSSTLIGKFLNGPSKGEPFATSNVGTSTGHTLKKGHKLSVFAIVSNGTLYGDVKVVTSSTKVGARVKGDDEYSWCIFKGKPLEVTNDKGRTLRLATGDKYGARKSSSGKQIRLVTEKDGLTKVFTCDADLAAYLGKNSKAV